MLLHASMFRVAMPIFKGRKPSCFFGLLRMVVVNVLLRVLRFARWLLFDVFRIVVVVGWLLRTTSS